MSDDDLIETDYLSGTFSSMLEEHGTMFMCQGTPPCTVEQIAKAMSLEAEAHYLKHPENLCDHNLRSKQAKDNGWEFFQQGLNQGLTSYCWHGADGPDCMGCSKERDTALFKWRVRHMVWMQTGMLRLWILNHVR